MSRTSQTKLNRLRSVLKGRDIDCLLVENADDILYLTSFHCSYGYVLITRTGAEFVTDTRYQLDAERHPVLRSLFHLTIQKKTRMATLKSLLNRAKVSTCIIDSQHTTIARFNELKDGFPKIRFIPVENVICDLRIIKTPDEIGRITSALRIAEKAFNDTLGHIREGVSERDIKTELEYRMLSHGADAPGFPTIIASGSNAATPHASVSDRRLRYREMVIMDFGVLKDGYHSDVTRTIHLGPPSKTFSERYRTVEETIIRAEERIRSGMSSMKADLLARQFLDHKGLGGYFTHSLGHGIGCEIHERPFLGPKGKDLLKPGMVFSIEPGIYIKAWGGIRIEDLVVMGKNNIKVLTELRKELIIL